ncbi:thyroid adenoma-associated protein homolog isoform X1 [Drosophila biarmipes]|uniref:thyroid adenoma-associated protein homolog isoform X1 n=1 Tax=Drosophila biarmipes TaxID=125945 RepID=UPI0007E730B3|nr:thyroid adenoma-associated protein homolog isoform X1 [Drosophila biarmipes]
MNDLNLRVAALKLCAHPKRFAELRDALVPLPERWKSAPQQYVRQFAVAGSSAEQVQVVKDIFFVDPQQDHEQVARFLADLLLASPLKHAVRNQLTKLFSDNALAKQDAKRLRGHSKEQLLEALQQSLGEMARSLAEITPTALSHDRTNDVFVSANACLQNFPFGREALGQQVHLFAPLLPSALERYWADISDPSLELSPTRRNELYLYVQNALRFLVSLLSEWSDQLRLCDGHRLLGPACAVAQKVARHMDTPWDVRSIAGLLIGHLARFSGTFQEYIAECSRPQAEQDLPVQTAALLVLRRTDYEEYAPQALAILKTIVSVGERESSVSNLLVFLSKHLFIYSKSLGEFQDLLPTPEQEIVYQQILAELQRFALQNISNATDSVRHMSSALLRQVLQHAQLAGREQLFQAVYRHFHAAPLSASCPALEQLVAVAGVSRCLEHCPSLFGAIFPRFLGCEDSVDALFRAMMVSAHKTQPFAEWHGLWIGQLLAAIQAPEKRRSVIEQQLTQAVQLEPQTLAHLLLRDARLPLSSKLAAILSVRQLSARRQELLRDLKQDVDQALLGLDDHTRLLALRFVVETPRPSEHLTTAEAEAIRLYLRHNANNPSAHLRQLGYGLLQKALRRIHLGLAEHQKRPTPAGEELLRLLTRLTGDLSRNLFPSANYGRRWLSLHLLRDCVELGRKLQLQIGEQQLPAEALPNLEHCLADSYEQNKVLAARLLETLQSRARFQPDEIIGLLLSLRPPDSATGAFQLQVYCRAQEVKHALPLPVKANETIHEPRTYRALQWCMEHLREGLCLAQRDLAEAAKLNPLYGLLFASRHLLQQLNLQQLAKEHAWRQYVEELVTTCLEVSRVVLPVVSSASPEGHLPATRDQETDQPLTNVLSRRLPSEALQQVRTTPQMVLLCAWRSIKEVCLILGELVQRAPLEEEQQWEQADFLLSSGQLEAIGELFLLLLAETKHRGAFEQAYVGFTMLCRRFWHSDSVRLNQLPGQWVSEAMAMVSGEEVRKARLCSTRRSAGMPFMLQALICTELKLGTHATLHRCMHRLLEVCERRTGGSAGITARSHALNILRALFRCSELAELVTEFMARGIQCALEGLLLAEEWAERNCATLLLAALIVRVFGVERARLETGELHVRNRMTGRIFFTRYPQLFDYFHAALQREAEQMDSIQAGSEAEIGGGKRRQAVQLEAMLLMLSRLYPSSLEGAESTLNLSEFVPFLIKICRSHDLMTRERAALVVANFVSQEQALAEIRRLVVELKALQLRLKKEKEAFILDTNLLHGQLLLLLQLHRLVRWTRPSLTRMQLHTLAALAAPILQRDACAFSALVEVMTASMEDAVDPEQLDYQLLEEIGAVYLLDHKEVRRRCREQGISMRFYQMFGLHLHRLRDISQGVVLHIVEDLSEPIWSLDELKVELWLYILLQRSLGEAHSLVSELDIEHFQFAADIRRYYQTLSPELRAEIAQELYRSQAVRSCVLQMRKASTSGCWSLQLAGRLAALQPLLQDPGLDLSGLVQRCSEEHSSHQEAGLVLGLKRLIAERKTLERQHWPPLLNYALHLVEPVQPLYLRHQAAELCDLLARKHLKDQLGLGVASVDVEVVGRFIRLVLLLLLDEAEWVRHKAAQLVCSAGFRSEVQVAKDILPSALTPEFLKAVLAKLEKQANDSDFLLRLFHLIAEPFLAAEAKDSEPNIDEDGDVEVFDKQVINLYCEPLLVLCELSAAFRGQFGKSQELMAAINALGLPADLVPS